MGLEDRTRLILGDQGIEALKNAHIILFGLGAVGGYVLEGLVRAGVGHLCVVDADVFTESNLNRQILAIDRTLGMKKVDAAVERAKSINPNVDIEGIDSFVDLNTIPKLLSKNFDIVIDAIDTIEPKCALLKYAAESDFCVFSSMGAALHFDATSVKIAKLKDTKVCPLASKVRSCLKDVDTDNITCVYSEEQVTVKPEMRDEHGKGVLGSLPTIPAIFGMTLANEVIKKIVLK